MIAVDTNILVYSHRRDSPFHKAATAALAELRSRSEPWAIPWPCIYEFINIVTHPRIYRPASSFKDAATSVDRWLAGDTVHLLHESADFWPSLVAFGEEAGVRGPQIHDARIAALCLRHGVRELWTADRDFSAVPRLKTRNPLT